MKPARTEAERACRQASEKMKARLIGETAKPVPQPANDDSFDEFRVLMELGNLGGRE